MRLGPFTLTLGRHKPPETKGAVAPFNSAEIGWWPVIRESFTGAWQRGVVTPIEDALAHPTYWACVTLIAGDVAKIRPMLVEESQGIDQEVARQSPYAAVLERPNHFQNRIQFLTCWMLSKLMRGNTYVLKQRDNRGIVTALYVLDPMRVRPLVSPSGDVFYACQQDLLSDITEASIVVPAREIIHDIGFAPYHPLCGLSPVYACGHMAIQGLTIVNNATRFFKNGSQIGGILVAPGPISEDNAKQIKANWDANYAGEQNAGAIAVLGNGLKFEKLDVMSAMDAQLIDQLKWGDEKICAVHHVPPYKVAVGPLPSYNNVEALGQQYYGDCLQLHFESIELCLTEGLEVQRNGYEVEFDISELDRMDSVQRMDVATKGVIGGIYKPNEARAKFNLKPVKGGNEVYLQRQNWPLEMLGGDNVPPAPALPPVKPDPPPPEKAIDLAALRASVLKRFEVAA